jgi:hypothetical protein
VDGRDKPGHDGAGKRRLARVAVIAAAALVVIGCAFAAWVASLGPLPLAQARQVSTTIVDRNGKLLRAYAMADGRWRLPVDARTTVDPGYLRLLLAYEDGRFYSHGGVDPLALSRAALQLVTRGHVVSGGSTITMQLARLMEPRRERSVYAKLRQMVRAVEIERQLTKGQILDLYLALAPFGGNLEACAPPRSPISARSRNGCRWPSRRCWWRCRSRRNGGGSTVIRKPRTRRAIACWIEWSKMAWFRKTTRCRPGRRQCRRCASRYRFWRRIPPTPPLRH